MPINAIYLHMVIYDSLQVPSPEKQLAPSSERAYLIRMVSMNQRAYYIVTDGLLAVPLGEMYLKMVTDRKS
jgi:hypothetical protein